MKNISTVKAQGLYPSMSPAPTTVKTPNLLNSSTRVEPPAAACLSAS